MHQIREQQSWAIHREVAARLRAHPDEVLGKALANLDRWAQARGEEPVMQEWRIRLERSTVEDLASWLESPEPDAVRMRQSSPFAGVLKPREVWEIKKHHAPA